MKLFYYINIYLSYLLKYEDFHFFLFCITIDVNV